MKIYKVIKMPLFLGILALIIYLLIPVTWVENLYKLKDSENPIVYEFDISYTDFVKEFGGYQWRDENGVLRTNNEWSHFIKKAIIFYRNSRPIDKRDTDTTKLLCVIGSSDRVSSSYLYRKSPWGDGRTEHTFDLFFKVDSVGENKIKISYVSGENVIIFGKRIRFSLHHLFELSDREVKIPPSTIQIYEVLRYVGKVVKQKNMPKIDYPKCLSKKQILNSFGENNPFTEEEIF